MRRPSVPTSWQSRGPARGLGEKSGHAKLAGLVAIALAIAAGTWVVIRPFWTPGIASQFDMLFSVYRLFELEESWRAGDLYPRVGADFAFGYGYPLFEYYAPLTAYLSLAFRGLGASYIGATKGAFTSLLLLGGLGSAAFTWSVFKRHSSTLVAGLLYVFAPYLLLNIYERGALAELGALALVPWTLLAFHWVLLGGGWGRVVGAAGALAALILSHNITALFFAIALGGYLLIGVVVRRDWPAIPRLLAAAGLGICLAAFFWLPAILESNTAKVGVLLVGAYSVVERLVGTVADLVQTNPKTDYWGAERFRLALIPAGLTALGIASALILSLPRRPAPGSVPPAAEPFRGSSWAADRWPLAALALIWVGSLAGQIRLTAPLWRHAPLVPYIEFPWRLFGLASLAGAVLAGAIPIAVAALGRRVMPDRLAVVLEAATAACIVIGAGVLATYHLAPSYTRAWYALDPATISVAGSQSRELNSGLVGFTSSGEFLPARLAFGGNEIAKPGSPVAIKEGTTPVGRVRPLGIGRLGYRLEVDGETPWQLLLPRLFYPGWQATVEGAKVVVGSSTDLALVGVDLPAGRHVVEVWLGESPTQQAGRLVSLLALAGVALVTARALRRNWRLSALSGVVVLIVGVGETALLGNANRLGAELAPTQISLVGADFGGEAELIGYRALVVDEPEVGQPKSANRMIDVTLYWLALRPASGDHQVVVALTSKPLDQAVVQSVGRPGNGFLPTTRWRPGELIVDTYHLVAPAGDSVTDLRLAAGLRRDDGSFLPSSGGASFDSADGLVSLGEFRVGAAEPTGR